MSKYNTFDSMNSKPVQAGTIQIIRNSETKLDFNTHQLLIDPYLKLVMQA